MFRLSHIVSLILAFTLGFSCAGGILVGGAAIALGTFRVRDLEKHEIMDIPDELFMEENPKTDLLNLTAFEMVDEMKRLYKMGDDVTINYLQSEYGLKLPSATQKFLTDEARNMPIKSLFSEKGVKALLGTMYIGYIQSFECHKLDSTEAGDPSLGEDGARWFNPTTGQYVTGLNETLAFICLGDFISGKVDIQAIIGGLHIGEALGYYSETDENGEEVWYDGVTGEPVTGFLGVFAGCTVNDIDDKINEVQVGELLGYYERDGIWYETDEEGNEVRLTGVMAVFAGCKIDEIGDKISTAKIGELLGYFEEDGVWYENDEHGEKQKVTGLMKALAPYPMDEVGDAINETELGLLLGYEKIDGKWYSQNDITGEYDEEVTGLMAVLADSYIDTVGDKIEETALGELLGYYERDGVWYEKIDGVETEVTGVMKVIAPSKMDGVGDTINEAGVGDLLGYKKVDGKWYEYDEELEADVEVDGFMSKIADEKMNSIGNAFDSLTVGDMVDEEDRDGIFSILSPDTPITDIASEINDSIMDSPLQFFMNEGLVSFDNEDPDSTDPSTAEILDNLSLLQNDYVFMSATDADFIEYYEGNGEWLVEGDKYKIPTWRTKPMSLSFAYIVTLLSGGAGIDE